MPDELPDQPSDQIEIIESATAEPIEPAHVGNIFEKVGIMNVFMALSVGFILIFTATAGVITNNLSNDVEDLEEKLEDLEERDNNQDSQITQLIQQDTDMQELTTGMQELTQSIINDLSSLSSQHNLSQVETTTMMQNFTGQFTDQEFAVAFLEGMIESIKENNSANFTSIETTIQQNLATLSGDVDLLRNQTSERIESLLVVSRPFEGKIACPIIDQYYDDLNFIITGYDDGNGNGIAGNGLLEDDEIVYESSESPYCSGPDAMHLLKDIYDGPSSPYVVQGSFDSYCRYTGNGAGNFEKSFAYVPSELRISNTGDVSECGSMPFDGTNSYGDSFARTYFGDYTHYDVEVTIITHMNLDNMILFTASDNLHGNELWVTDGSEDGTMLLSDINPGPSHSNVKFYLEFENKIYFTADDGTHGQELWVTDGTELGTHMVKETNLNGDSNIYNKIVEFNNKMIFVADSQINTPTGVTDFGNELWVSDGTESGTMLLKDINPGSESGADNYWTLKTHAIMDGNLYFDANNGINGSELYVTDGTPTGTGMLINIAPDDVVETSSGPDNFHVVGDKFFFTADNGTTGDELWISDGTIEGTSLVKEIVNYTHYYSTGGSYNYGLSGQIYPLGDKIIIPTVNNNLTTTDGNGTELWVSNGTEEGTYMLKDINPGTASGYASGGMFLFEDKYYFIGNDGVNSSELWVTDGTSEGTTMVKDIATAGSSSPQLVNAQIYDGKMYFYANDGVNGLELWVSNGTGNGTMMVKDLRVGSGDSILPYVNPIFYQFNGSMYFTASDGIHGLELWVTDGTEDGTRMVNDLYRNTGSSYIHSFMTLGDKLIFAGYEPINGIELWYLQG
tara:strand:- start:99 stop:2648 length:2550 start_codon:yes stop_codon:yes gene_type:complete